jgi:hypothetical protein
VLDLAASKSYAAAVGTRAGVELNVRSDLEVILSACHDAAVYGVEYFSSPGARDRDVEHGVVQLEGARDELAQLVAAPSRG